MTDKEKIKLLIAQSAPFTFLERWEDADFNKLTTGIETLLKEREKEAVKQIKNKFMEIAIEGSADKDEMKGLMLYTRFLEYLQSNNLEQI